MSQGQVPPLDLQTHQAVAQVVYDAQRQGLSPVEELNRRGLILTRARRELLAVVGLEMLLDQLLAWMPHEMLRKVNKKAEAGTPADMYEAFKQFTEELISHIKTRGL
jgi:hypothetical protein